MASATPTAWITLIAAFGLGSIMAAIVGWLSAKAVAISNHRQNWINALRDHIAQYLNKIEVIHNRVVAVDGGHGKPGTTEDLERLQEARNDALLTYRLILLRLNMTEKSHILLAQRLEEFLLVQEFTPDSQKMRDVLTQARQVLKEEWDVTKYGVFTKPIISLKNLWRRSFRKAWPPSHSLGT
jgi:hypothetical protein